MEDDFKIYDTVTYMTVVRQRLGKHFSTNAQPKKQEHPLLGNGSVNTSRGNE
jgi:hypothetical protein